MKPSLDIHREMLKIPDLARICLTEHGIGLDYQSWWRRISSGEIPARKIGGSWRIDPKDVDAIAEKLKASRYARVTNAAA